MVPALARLRLSLPVETLLRRTVRFAARPDAPRGPNGYAASPPARTIAQFLECTVECRGEPDPQSGYLLNIKTIDDAVHRHVRPLIAAARDPHGADLGPLLRDALHALDHALPVPVDRLELALSPYHALAMTTADPQHAEIRLRFDFAAAHRLHVPAWSDQANREHFGKCNNPNGHGHNYQLEVRVALPAAQMGAFSTDALERAVQATVIDRFDHKHLNHDTAEFADGDGLNPSVENIARVCYDLLAAPVARLPGAPALRSVRVWETDRTSSRYPA